MNPSPSPRLPLLFAVALVETLDPDIRTKTAQRLRELSIRAGEDGDAELCESGMKLAKLLDPEIGSR